MGLQILKRRGKHRSARRRGGRTRACIDFTTLRGTCYSRLPALKRFLNTLRKSDSFSRPA